MRVATLSLSSGQSRRNRVTPAPGSPDGVNDGTDPGPANTQINNEETSQIV